MNNWVLWPIVFPLIVLGLWFFIRQTSYQTKIRKYWKQLQNKDQWGRKIDPIVTFRLLLLNLNEGQEVEDDDFLPRTKTAEKAGILDWCLINVRQRVFEFELRSYLNTLRNSPRFFLFSKSFTERIGQLNDYMKKAGYTYFSQLETDPNEIRNLFRRQIIETLRGEWETASRLLDRIRRGQATDYNHHPVVFLFSSPFL